MSASPAQPLPEYLTILQAAARLQLTPITIRRMVARGDLPAWKCGHVIRIDAAQLTELFHTTPKS